MVANPFRSETLPDRSPAYMYMRSDQALEGTNGFLFSPKETDPVKRALLLQKDQLEFPSKDCQFVALLGLNHIANLQTAVLGNDHICLHRELSAREVEFAKACSQGNVP